MKRIVSIKMVAVVICVSLIPVIVGCSKVNQENFDKIKIGMTYEEVVAILGKQQTCEEIIMKTKDCMWGSSSKQVNIKFVGDTVVWKSAKGL